MNDAQLRQIEEYLDLKTIPPVPVDLLFVFGTRLAEPALIAADYLKRNAARYVVLTGGPNRYLAGTEAEAHFKILSGLGVPSDRIILENRSSNTLENVTFAVPKIREALNIDSVQTIAAVVKWYHCRRAIMTLKQNLPIKARYYALTYEPESIGRTNWWMTDESRRRVLKEWDNIPRYLEKGYIADIQGEDGGLI